MPTLGVVIAQFYDDLASEMERHARSAAAERDAEIGEVVAVPGAYDTPLAADRLARQEAINAVCVLGTVVSGDTDHDDVIVRSVARALTDVSLDRDTPIGFGVLGPDMSMAEARERVDKGAEAVDGALDQLEALP